MPNRVLLAMYRRMFAGPTGPRPPGKKRSLAVEPAIGRLAAQAAVAVSLREGDLVSASPGTSFSFMPAASLPAAADPTDRISMVIGAGLALRPASGLRRSARRRPGAVCVCFFHGADLPAAVWRRTLRFASDHRVPILFVVVPGERPGRTGLLSGSSAKLGIPGFPVDAGDAVAMYRVVQESLGRLRAGDGPVLIEAVPWNFGPDRGTAAEDRLRAQLTERGVAVPRSAPAPSRKPGSGLTG